MKLNLSEAHFNLMSQQLKHDSELFQTGNINDYSLLVGICELKPGEADRIRKKSPNPQEYMIENFIKSNKTAGLEESAT